MTRKVNPHHPRKPAYSDDLAALSDDPPDFPESPDVEPSEDLLAASAPFL
jgi:hypothetical protein